MQSTREISKRIADYLELADPAGYSASERAKTVSAVNDILQGRGERGMDSLLAELEQKCGESYAAEIAGVRRDMEHLWIRKQLCSMPTRSPAKSGTNINCMTGAANRR